MNIFFPVFQWAKPSMQGVLKKVSAQTKAFKEHGVSIQTIVYGCHDPLVKRLDGLDYVHIQPSATRYLIQLYEVRKKSFEKAFAHIRSTQPDLVYTRYMGGGWNAIRFAKKVRSICPLVFEHQAIEPKELLQQKKWPLFIMESVFGKATVRHASGIIGVTEEIASYEAHRANTPMGIIPNGTDVASLPCLSTPLFSDEIVLIFVGSTNRWHGVDRLLYGLKAYKGLMPVRLMVVGSNTENDHLMKLAGNLALEEVVSFLGYQSGEALDEMFHKAHVAIGSLGAHRTGLKQASPLKVRGYCSRGIPFIYGYEDPDFQDDFPFALQLPANDYPVDIQQIIEFYKQVRKIPDYPMKMRDYAFSKLNWTVKIGETLSFVKKIILA